MLLPSTITARRTRRYTSTLYIHRTIHGVGYNPYGWRWTVQFTTAVCQRLPARTGQFTSAAYRLCISTTGKPSGPVVRAGWTWIGPNRRRPGAGYEGLPDDARPYRLAVRPRDVDVSERECGTRTAHGNGRATSSSFNVDSAALGTVPVKDRCISRLRDEYQSHTTSRSRSHSRRGQGCSRPYRRNRKRSLSCPPTTPSALRPNSAGRPRWSAFRGSPGHR